MIERLPKQRFADRIFALVGLRIVLWFFVAASVFPVLFPNPNNVTAHRDEHFYYAHDDAARMTFAKYHELPAWNPYLCGGIPGIANPQDASLSPDFILRLAFGTGPGRRLAILLLIILGMEGMFQLARRSDTSPLGSIFAALIWGTCGFFGDVLALGWVNFFGFELLPWAILGLLGGIQSFRWRLVGGCMLGWMALQGGTYSVPYCGLALAVLAIASAIRATGKHAQFRWHQPLASLITIGIVAIAVSAAKLVPMMVLVSKFPRSWESQEVHTALEIFGGLIVRPSTLYGPVAAHIGMLVIGLALLAPCLGDRSGAWAVGVALFFFTLAMGDFAPWAPNSLLHAFPIFSQLRLPHRFLVVVAFFLCFSAGRTVSLVEDAIVTLSKQLRMRLGSAHVSGTWFGIGSGVFAMFVVARVLFPHAFDVFQTNAFGVGYYSMDVPLQGHDDFRQSRGNRWDAQVWAPAERGSLACFEETQFPQSTELRGDLSADEYSRDPQAARVTRQSWSPNRIALHVSAQAPATIIVNQNYHSSWHVNVGAIRNDRGLLSVVLPSGEHDVVLKYRDPWLMVGLSVSLISIAAIVNAFGRWLRARYSSATSAMPPPSL